MHAVLDLAARARPSLVDLTGGAPELHPRIRWFVDALRDAGHEVQLRTNLVVLQEPDCLDLPSRWAERGVRLLASLPSLDPTETDYQRGKGVFDRSIELLRALCHLGYGGDRARLDLAVNPVGHELPGDQQELSEMYHDTLQARHGISFHELVLITNMPLGRFGSSLEQQHERAAYLSTLEQAFNPETVPLLACRPSLVVAWDGALYDCDFNLGAGLPCREGLKVDAPTSALANRKLAFGAHCFACTASSGSS